MYVHVIVIVIGEVTGVTLTCELIGLFDHYCSVMWNAVQVCIYIHIYMQTYIPFMYMLLYKISGYFNTPQ